MWKSTRTGIHELQVAPKPDSLHVGLLALTGPVQSSGCTKAHMKSVGVDAPGCYSNNPWKRRLGLITCPHNVTLAWALARVSATSAAPSARAALTGGSTLTHGRATRELSGCLWALRCGGGGRQAASWREKVNAWKSNYNRHANLVAGEPEPCPICDACEAPTFCYPKYGAICPELQCEGTTHAHNHKPSELAPGLARTCVAACCGSIVTLLHCPTALYRGTFSSPHTLCHVSVRPAGTRTCHVRFSRTTNVSGIQVERA
jgi:hypothetical protein